MRTNKFSPSTNKHSSISIEKAKQILSQGLLRRDKLTENQRRYLCSVSTGGIQRGER